MFVYIFIGESVPQLKDSLRAFDDCSATIDLGLDSSIDENWRKYMVFGGTTMLQSKEGSKESGRVGVVEKVPDAPSPGCLAVVVRTGFGTSQGGMYGNLFCIDNNTSFFTCI